MTVLELMERLTAIGASVRAEGHEVAVRFPEGHRQEVEELGPEIRRLKPDLMRALGGSPPVRSVAKETNADMETSADYPTASHYGLRWSDPYWLAALGAQERLGKIDWPPDLGAWLRLNRPEMYRRLFVELPEEIDRLWDLRADLEGFRTVLGEWVETHWKALEMSPTSKR
jgi:hypothetical protein